MKEGKENIYSLTINKTFETHSGAKFKLIKHGRKKRVVSTDTGQLFLLSEFERTILINIK